MKTRNIITTALACGVLSLAVVGSGCKKDEQSKENIPAVSSQTVPAMSKKDYSFETGMGDWKPTDKIKTEVVTNIKHEGAKSLKIEGNSPSGVWSYLKTSHIQLAPGKKYRLTGWMYLESSDSSTPPHIKCALYSNSKYQGNKITSRYQLAKKGEWQQLTVEFTTPNLDKLSGVLAVEKGTDKPVTTVLYVDDITFEQLD